MLEKVEERSVQVLIYSRDDTTPKIRNKALENIGNLKKISGLTCLSVPFLDGLVSKRSFDSLSRDGIS